MIPMLREFWGNPSSAYAFGSQVQGHVETARTRIKRALALLRGRLDREHGGDGRTWALALLPLTRMTRGTIATSATGGTAVAISMKTVRKAGLPALLHSRSSSASTPASIFCSQVSSSQEGW